MKQEQHSGISPNFEELMRDLHYHAGELRQPVNGTFELTERCNLACRMCYINQSAKDVLNQSKELNAESWLNIARQAVDNGMVFLLFTGGEIFTRPDFFEIYTPTTQLGLFITLFSNGTLISNNVASRLADSPPNRIAITLYGASESTYKSITGRSNAFYRCCKGIDALLKYGISVDLRTVITNFNVSEIESMRKLAQSWGLSISMGYELIRRRDGMPSDVDKCRLAASQCLELESTDYLSSEWTEEVKRKTALGSNYNFDCNAGHGAFAINSQGEMNACVDLPFPASLPLKIGFENSWKQVQQFVDSAPVMSHFCGNCEVRIFCSRCPMWSYMETKTLIDPVPYLCEIAQARSKKAKM